MNIFRTYLILSLALGISSCVPMPGLPGGAHANYIRNPETGVWCRYNYKIPVRRPSEIEQSQLLKAAHDLARDHQVSNIVYDAGDPPQLTKPAQRLDDDYWRDAMMDDDHVSRPTRPDDRKWDFDPGSMAHVYLRKGKTWGYWSEEPWWGSVLLVKDGDVIGYKNLGGMNPNLDKYYRDLKKLGFYLPEVPGGAVR